MRKKRKQLLASILAFVVMLSTIIGNNTIAKAGTAPNVEAQFYRLGEENAFSYSGVLGLFGNVFRRTDDIHTEAGLPSRNGVLNYRVSNDAMAKYVPSYCLDYNKTVPQYEPNGDNETLKYWTLDSNTYVNEVLSADQWNKVQKILQVGYPANREYWENNGVGDYYVQMVATQLAIWYVTTSRNDGIVTQLNQHMLPANQRSDPSRYFKVNTDVYTASAGGGKMLDTLLEYATDSTKEVTEIEMKVTVSAVSGPTYNNGKYDYEYTVKGENIDYRYGIDLTAEGAPEGSEINAYWLDVESSEWKKVAKSGSNFKEGTSKYPYWKVVVTAPKASNNINLVAKAHRVDDNYSYIFTPGQSGYQRVLMASIKLKDADDNAILNGVPLIFDAYKCDDESGEVISGITFAKQKADGSDYGTCVSDQNGWLGFYMDWDTDYYVWEAANGNHANTTMHYKFGSAEKTVQFGAKVKVRANYR